MVIRESAEDRLARLRRRVTASFALVAVLGVAGLAIITTVVDGRLRADRFDTELQGQAFRAAALVFFDDDRGEWNVTGIADDLVAQSADGIVVVDEASGRVLLETAPIDGADALIDSVLQDDAEAGSLGTVVIGGRELAAAGAPYFGSIGGDESVVDAASNDVAGAVIVASQRTSDPDRTRLIAFVWGAAAALIALSAAVAWLVAGRVVRPLAEQLDREEMFLATAAHELRTPLGRLRAVTDSALMTSATLPASSDRDLLDTDLHRLVQLNEETTRSVEDLLLVGRIEAGVLSGRHERIQLDRMVAAFEADTPELAVETSGPVHVIGDPTLVHHAVSNLILNARRHARRVGVELLIRATVTSDGSDAEVTVADNGPGLGSDPEVLFARHRTDASDIQVGAVAGSGLGLWIVRTIVDDAGGTVRGHTAAEGGALFEIRWPLAPVED